MGHRNVTVEIDASPDVVFGLYVNPARFGEWQSGVKEVAAPRPLDQPGTHWSAKYGGPFRISGEVLAVDRGVRHAQPIQELLGLVTCTTTARFEPIGTGTRLAVDLDYMVAGGPPGRAFDGMVGNEMTSTFRKELAKLKAISEESSQTASNRQPQATVLTDAGLPHSVE